MSQRIGAPGIYLPLPTNLYPSYLTNAPIDLPCNAVTLQPGQNLPLAAGDWEVYPGNYSFIQVLDPVTQTWRIIEAARDKLHRVKSDGFNIRVANLLGCPVGAIVTDGGDGDLVQADLTITPSVGNSTWQGIVGGMCSVVSVHTAGRNYSIPPLVLIGAPPAPGVQATGFAVLTGTSVSSVVLTNVGAGYTSIPPISVQPNPTDPNLANGNITQAVVSLALVGGTAAAGSLAAVLCTNPGVSVASVPTLTVGGTGTGSPAATAVRLSALTAATIQSAGAGYTDGAILMALLGRPSATPLYTNPATDFSAFVPRPAIADLAVTGGSLISVATVYDGGIFAGTPAAVVLPKGGAEPGTGSSVTLTTGTYNDTVLIQPAP